MIGKYADDYADNNFDQNRNMTSKQKDILVRRIIDGRTPGGNCSLSSFVSVDDGIGMGEAMEVILELKQRGFVEKYQCAAEDLRFSINSGLETFSKRGGFEIEDVEFQAQFQKIFLEVAALKKELSPSLYDKIMKILEPLAQFAGIAVEAIIAR